MSASEEILRACHHGKHYCKIKIRSKLISPILQGLTGFMDRIDIKDIITGNAAHKSTVNTDRKQRIIK